ncbi:MAG: acyl-CoA dehydrogenase family protein [Acidimicrobiales bacterium]
MSDTNDPFDPAGLRAAFDERLVKRSEQTRTTVMGAGSDDLVDAGRAYLKALADGGWAVPTWPKEYGGMGATPAQAAVVADALRHYETPDLYAFSIGLGIGGPTMIDLGSPELCARILPRTASGEDIWCQLFSEPNAGSDLANLGCAAQRDGDEWVLSGQKVWTSRGMWARWGFLLARTNVEVPKHKGITAFLIDMAAPGVDVRPLRQMNGDQHFSEVFLSEVRVPDANRIGAEGDGWRVAITALGYERGGVTTRHTASGGTQGRLMALVRESGGAADLVTRQRLAHLVSYTKAASWTAERAAASAKSGAPGPAGSGGKIRWGDQLKMTGRLAKDLQGPLGMLAEDGEDGWHTIFMTGPSMSIRGGTDEIQRNIVGERVLGLPPEPRVDKDQPFSQVKRSGA